MRRAPRQSSCRSPSDTIRMHAAGDEIDLATLFQAI